MTPTPSPSAECRDFELRRPRVIGCLILAAFLLVSYWLAWFMDRSVVASDHTAEYKAFEQSFPLADAMLLGAILAAAIQMSRRQPSAFVWLEVVGAVGVYLCALDVLYDLEHAIYTKGAGGAIELAINVITAAFGFGVMKFAWRFRHALLVDQPHPATWAKGR
jgi:UDP-N-acetylmuramyl pentapeptide phosphotransferase/UDP-N-acetylglucosamine-1-phosphate transferase